MSTDAADESASAQRILAWAYLVAFALLTGLGRGVLFAAGGEDSARSALVMGFGFPVLVWVWLVSQGRPHRAAFPLDLGMFVAAAWPLVVPAYLWRFERWRGLGKAALALALYPLGYALTLAAYYALATLLAVGRDG
ncbi:MAG: hypothetical protein ABW221_09520 [Vicinamibacteria bacterium]